MKNRPRLYCGHLVVHDAGSCPFDVVAIEALEYIANRPTNDAIAKPDDLQLYSHTFAVLESAHTIHIDDAMAH